MYMLPGKDGYGATFHDDSFGANATKWDNASEILNTGINPNFARHKCICRLRILPSGSRSVHALLQHWGQRCYGPIASATVVQ